MVAQPAIDLQARARCPHRFQGSRNATLQVRFARDLARSISLPTLRALAYKLCSVASREDSDRRLAIIQRAGRSWAGIGSVIRLRPRRCPSSSRITPQFRSTRARRSGPATREQLSGNQVSGAPRHRRYVHTGPRREGRTPRSIYMWRRRRSTCHWWKMI